MSISPDRSLGMRRSKSIITLSRTRARLTMLNNTLGGICLEQVYPLSVNIEYKQAVSHAPPVMSGSSGRSMRCNDGCDSTSGSLELNS
jgi:hypothetical protein